MAVRIMQGHVLGRLALLEDGSVHCVVTSPPYYGLRDYKIEPQIWNGTPECEHEWGGGLRHTRGSGKQGGNVEAQETARDAGWSRRWASTSITWSKSSARCAACCGRTGRFF